MKSDPMQAVKMVNKKLNHRGMESTWSELFRSVCQNSGLSQWSMQSEKITVADPFVKQCEGMDVVVKFYLPFDQIVTSIIEQRKQGQVYYGFS